ncbi:type II toxin-antitoxin system PemK/MazF family toxin [Methylobacterium sp. E-066]|uniref:type II toxin-antitoxin system PemK/MazF family toxin n=1 Tax=Methylobacterium sp. E-066 TaxID=2836584 RepID=UPI001FBBFE7F|nr:type II toxin-antitoxin system PemK/MazF family toxin [Methylobacterium sp. E-066]MCJ2140534.1 type II toxin-antitoxin system PemK/MazF family toxin [Methylobacterium sp. E-066]
MTTGRDVHDLPEAGDLVWVDLRPTLGREQSGVRPALVLTSRDFHARNATAIVCPVTRNIDPWPTKVMLPQGLAISGAMLTDQIRNVDRAARGFRRIDGVPVETLDAVRQKLANLLGFNPPS